MSKFIKHEGVNVVETANKFILEGKRVLVVEDSPFAKRCEKGVLFEQLSKCGNAFLEYLHFDIVLMDNCNIKVIEDYTLSTPDQTLINSIKELKEVAEKLCREYNTDEIGIKKEKGVWTIVSFNYLVKDYIDANGNMLYRDYLKKYVSYEVTEVNLKNEGYKINFHTEII